MASEVSTTKSYFSCCTPSDQERSETSNRLIYIAKVAIAALNLSAGAAALAFAVGASLPIIIVAAAGTAAVVCLIALVLFLVSQRKNETPNEEIEVVRATFKVSQFRAEAVLGLGRANWDSIPLD